MHFLTRSIVIIAAIATLLSLNSVTLADLSATGDVSPSDPSTWISSTKVRIGPRTTGTVTVDDGSDLQSDYTILGNFKGSLGQVVVDGKGSTWAVSERLFISNSGDGSLDITNGGAVSVGNSLVVGNSGTGSLLVDGDGSMLTGAPIAGMTVGNSGEGALAITNGGVVSLKNGVNVGNAKDSIGKIIVDGPGSTFTNTKRSGLTIGGSGDGTLTITNGGTVSLKNMLLIGHSGVGRVTVDGSKSRLIAPFMFKMGHKGHGTIDVTGGASFVSRNAFLGKSPGSSAVATIDGTGTTWANDRRLTVGASGDVVLKITNGALVSTSTLTIDWRDVDSDSHIDMTSGGMLAISGNKEGSIVDFLSLVSGSDDIRFFDGSDWSHITNGTKKVDYFLKYHAEGDLAGFTVLTVGKP